MVLLSLAYRSLKNRKLTTILTLVSLALSVSLWVGIEHIRSAARESFSNTISQTDLIVGRPRRFDSVAALHGLSHGHPHRQREL